MASFQVLVATGSKSISPFDGAGTDAEVTLNLLGEKSSSGPLPLQNGSRQDLFEAGHLDAFSFDIREDLGALRFVEITSSGTGPSPDWRLGAVIVNAVVFPGKDVVLSRAKGLVVRLDRAGPVSALTAPGGGDASAASKTYNVIVATSTGRIAAFDGAGTDADIQINLIGDQASSGFHALENRLGKDLFESGQLDQFSVVTRPDLGRLQFVELRSSGTRASPGWRLRSVLVDGEVFPGNEVVLSASEGLLVRLGRNGPVLGPPVPASGNAIYTVVLQTADWNQLPGQKPSDDAGTRAAITVTILGERGSALPMPLIDPRERVLFRPGGSDTFQVECINVGTPRSVVLQHSGMADAWGVTRVTVNGIDFPTVPGVAEGGTSNVLVLDSVDRALQLTPAGPVARYRDIDGLTAAAYLKVKLEDVFLLAAYTDMQRSIVVDSFVKRQTGEASSFAELFVNVQKETAVLLDRLPHTPSDDPERARVEAELKRWVLMRDSTQGLFNRMDAYFDSLKTDLEEELEELKDAFTRAMQLNVMHSPGTAAPGSDVVNAIALTLSGLALVPNPVVQIAAGAASLLTGIISAYALSEGQSPTEMSKLSGGQVEYLKVVDDQFFALGRSLDVLLKSLRKTSLRSIAMLRACEGFERRIADEILNLDPTEENAVMARYFPAESGLRNLLRPYWEKLLVQEAVLYCDPDDSSVVSQFLVATSTLTPSAADRLRWTLCLAGPDGLPEQATALSRKAFEHLLWLFGAQELLRLMIRSGRAWANVNQTVLLPGAIPRTTEVREWLRLNRDGTAVGAQVRLNRQAFWQVQDRAAVRNLDGSVVIGGPVSRTVTLDMLLA